MTEETFWGQHRASPKASSFGDGLQAFAGSKESTEACVL